MENTNFGSLLKEARERRCLTLSAIAEKTKVSPPALKLLETGKLDDLPAEIYVRGFIRSYAKAVGISDAEPIGMFEQALAARRRAEETFATTRNALIRGENGTVGAVDGAGGGVDDEGVSPRRGIGLAVFVIIVLLIATITLSLFMRQPPESGERLSQRDAPRSALVDSAGPTG